MQIIIDNEERAYLKILDNRGLDYTYDFFKTLSAIYPDGVKKINKKFAIIDKKTYIKCLEHQYFCRLNGV